MPNNGSILSLVMSSNTYYEKNPSNKNEQTNEITCVSPKQRRWSFGRLQSSDVNSKNYYLERRMTLPLSKPKKSQVPKCELITPVKNEGNNCNELPESIKLNSIFTFWRTEHDLNLLLEKIDLSSAAEINKICEMINLKSQTESFSATELAEIVQSLYKIADKKIRRKVFDNEITEDNARRTFVKFENRLMKGLHENAFGKILLEETPSDRRLSNIIEELSWITPQHLAVRIDDSNDEVSDKFDKAMLDIATINFKESPIAKLRCIMNCSKRIFDILKTKSDSTETADDFLSILVFVVLQANPARLHSNIRYVLQFGNSDQIMKGEEGYYFTHLCSVVAFIENLSARSLDLSEEEFRLLSSNSKISKPNKCSVRTRRISCSREMSLCICKIYHQAVDESSIQIDSDSSWEKSVAVQE